MMEREIKFRGFDTANKIMYSADELGNDELQIHPNGKGFFNANPHAVGHSTFFEHIIPMQFTGLKDKNGKDIYEDDVVKLVSNHIADLTSDPKYITTTICKVWFDKGMFKFNDMTMDYGGLYRGELEVIGNIHENPELLTQLEKK